ncbi:hypothetical protein Spla01_00633 [Streptomyces platensis]|uniref:Uncharacterized protein n=1 Tax=Streptomyces platensis TaxID=58346 RepID=A0ABX3Y2P6_STRPT|nr:hypothetical protein BG653_01129 [Streptomyces platensis]
MAIAVPAPHGDAWRVLGRARSGEGNRPWSAAAGAGALATGVAQTAWMLSRLHILAPEASATTRPERFAAGQARLLLAEAFVSGTGKPVPVAAGQHAADAEAAARATLTYLDGRGGDAGTRVRWKKKSVGDSFLSITHSRTLSVSRRKWSMMGSWS